MSERWVVMSLQDWDCFEADPPISLKVSISPHEGCVGWLPVYDSLEAAKADYPNAEIVGIKDREAV